MADRRSMSEFDYEAAEADTKARLAEFPPSARARHLDGMGWVEGSPLSVEEVDAVQFDEEVSVEDILKDLKRRESERCEASTLQATQRAVTHTKTNAQRGDVAGPVR